MRFVLGKVAVDDLRLRRIVEVVLDFVDFGDLRQLGDVKSTLVECDAVRPVEARKQRLDLVLPVLVGNGVDLVGQAAAHKHGAFLAHPD